MIGPCGYSVSWGGKRSAARVLVLLVWAMQWRYTAVLHPEWGSGRTGGSIRSCSSRPPGSHSAAPSSGCFCGGPHRCAVSCEKYSSCCRTSPASDARHHVPGDKLIHAAKAVD